MKGEEQISAERNYLLDFWKFVFSAIVVLLHSLYFSGDTKILVGGYLSVEFFFIVSGIFLAKSSEKGLSGISLGKSTLQYIKNKIVRFNPNYLIALALALIVRLGFTELSRTDIFKNVITSLAWESTFLTYTGLYGYYANGPTWYLSAMLLALFVLYPLMMKFKDNFFYIISPLAVMFLLGYAYQTFGHLASPYAWLGYTYRGVYRAFLGLMLGCICYKAGNLLARQSFSIFFRCLISLVETAIYLAIIYYMATQKAVSKYDFLVVAGFAVCITLTYSKAGILHGITHWKLLGWLGEFSFSLYLGHSCWARRMTDFFPEYDLKEKMLVYVALSLVTGLLIMYSSKLVVFLWRRAKPIAHKMVFTEGQN